MSPIAQDLEAIVTEEVNCAVARIETRIALLLGEPSTRPRAKPVPATIESRLASGKQPTAAQIAEILVTMVQPETTYGISDLAKILPYPTTKLARALRKLVLDGRLRTEGKNRVARYFLASRPE